MDRTPPTSSSYKFCLGIFWRIGLGQVLKSRVVQTAFVEVVEQIRLFNDQNGIVQILTLKKWMQIDQQVEQILFPIQIRNDHHSQVFFFRANLLISATSSIFWESLMSKYLSKISFNFMSVASLLAGMAGIETLGKLIDSAEF
ncbi:hypothetical protein BpHYR1_047339 [Brachionus plicatilis]|uniref:Uncharacterized protein n=1 Tax=Brachionus plicatilis TaxID=10195 RepID=A0A3M7RTQ4_BRAPC|nr:hypothetical protein BpHYR1_047339 [Brachionus plicatilis]